MFQSQLRQQLEALRLVRVVGERERDRAVQEGHQCGRRGRVSGPVHSAGARRADIGVERVREADEEVDQIEIPGSVNVVRPVELCAACQPSYEPCVHVRGEKNREDAPNPCMAGSSGAWTLWHRLSAGVGNGSHWSGERKRVRTEGPDALVRVCPCAQEESARCLEREVALECGETFVLRRQCVICARVER